MALGNGSHLCEYLPPDHLDHPLFPHAHTHYYNRSNLLTLLIPSSRRLMLVPEQLACLHPSQYKAPYLANLTLFSFIDSFISSWTCFLFFFLRSWLSDTYNWRCDRFYSFYTNTLYWPVKGCSWGVGNGCVRLRLSNLSLCVCAGMCVVLYAHVVCVAAHHNNISFVELS